MSELAAPDPPRPHAAPPVVSGPERKRHSIKRAARLIGQRAIVVGRVDHLDFVGRDLVVYFRDDAGGAPFIAVVPGADVARLQSSAEVWDMKLVEVEGDVTTYEGIPAITVRSASQVRLINRDLHVVKVR